MKSAADNGIKRLYHYEPFKPEYLSDLLQNQRVHCSDLSNLNDPWDCKPHFDAENIDPDWHKESFAHFLLSSPRSESELRAGIRMFESPDHVGFAEKATRELNEIKAVRWTIYCLTPHPDSILMWSHYADNHSGICLEFSTQVGRIIQSAIQIRYSRTFPSYSLNKAVTQDLLALKSEVWDYEDEYRVIRGRTEALADPNNGNLFFVAKDNFIPIEPGELVSVIAGCRSDLDAIRSVVNEHAPGLTVKRAIQIPNHFSLRIEDCCG